MSVARRLQGLQHPIDAYPVLDILREREQVFALRRSERISRSIAEQRLSGLEARERVALDQLRETLKAHRAVTQDKVAKALRVDRTMVNKVWNSGLPGRDRQWTRSARIIAATYRALEAAGWQARPASAVAS